MAPPPKVHRHHHPSVHISSDDICKSKSRSMSNLGLDFRLFSRQRKAVSDNSLKKISLRNLPHFLRSLSSQSTHSASQKAMSACLQQSRSGQLMPYAASSGPITYCRSEATIVDNSSRTRVWSPTDRRRNADDGVEAMSSADEADIDDEDDLVTNEKTKVLVRRKGGCYLPESTKPKDEQGKGAGGTSQQMPLCGTNSTTSDDTPLIDREVKPAIRPPR